jgi:hypothetical protein
VSDQRWPLNQLLDIVGRPGVYQTLTALRLRDDALTFAEIDGEVYPHTGPCLRMLAAEGFVSSPRCGSWDDVIDADTPFSLTAAGAELLTHLHALEAWAAEFPRPAMQQRRRTT